MNSDKGKIEVLDFVEFIREKERKELENLMDVVIDENKEALEELAK
ncbi:MAG TPA: hypothetical protein VIK77_05570 [Tissierellaceae bacterium]